MNNLLSIKNIIFYFLTGCFLLFFIYVYSNIYWLNSTEKSLLNFIKISNLNSPVLLINSIIKQEFLIKKNDFVCIFDAYQTKIRYNDVVISKKDLLDITSELSRIKYRSGTLGLLSSESHWSFVFMNNKNYLKNIEISSNKIPVVLSKNGGDCFRLKNIAIEKVKLIQYPYGFGLRIFNINSEEKL